MKPVVYEGAEPYIFVSYAHKDSVAVYEVLHELEAQGYRLWYDDGIAPGSEWPEDIAQHLDAASMVVSFVTPNSMASQNCRREINFALARCKPFLSILMEPTDMPLGMEMQLSAQQSIVRYNYETWEAFIKKILSCPNIAPCRKAPEPEPASVPASQAIVEEPASAAQPGTAPAPAFVAQHESMPAPASPSERLSDPDVRHKPVAADDAGAASRVETAGGAPAGAALPSREKRLGEAGENKEKPGAKKKGVILAAIAALVVLAVAVFAFGGDLPTSSVTTSWGGKIKANDTSIVASGKVVTQEDIQKMANLKSLRSISLENCDFSGCDFSKVDFASDEFSSFCVSGSSGISDFSFLSAFSLNELDVSGCSSFDDLSILDVESLRKLDVSGTAVQSLDPIAECDLSELKFSHTAVSDLTPVSGQMGLSTIDGSYSGVTSLDAIMQLEDLYSVDFSGCSLETPGEALKSLSLEDVRLANTGLADLKLLANCTVLETLDISGNQSLSNFSDLSDKNCETLTTLGLAQTKLDDEGLQFVSQCTEVTKLTLDGAVLGNLDLCESMASLKQLSAVNCGITDINGLAGCAQLENVYLSCNQISDVSPLAGIAFDDGRDVVLDLTFNQVDSVESLAGGEYRALLLYGNGEELALSIPADLATKEVVVSWCPGVESSALAGEGVTMDLYLVDCPPTETLTVENAMSAYTKLITEDELLTMYAEDSFSYPLRHDNSYFLSVAGEGNSADGSIETATSTATW